VSVNSHVTLNEGNNITLWTRQLVLHKNAGQVRFVQDAS